MELNLDIKPLDGVEGEPIGFKTAGFFSYEADDFPSEQLLEELTGDLTKIDLTAAFDS